LEWSIHRTGIQRLALFPGSTAGVVGAQDLVLTTDTLVGALVDLRYASVIWTTDWILVRAELLLRTEILVGSTDRSVASLIEATLDGLIDRTTIAEALLSILLLTGSIILGTLTILVALFRRVEWTTVGLSALGRVLDTLARLTSVWELCWAGVGNWAVFLVDTA